MPESNSDLEIEVKFYLIDLKHIRKRVLGLGASSQGRFLEHNIRFDRPGADLQRKASLLRLRQDRHATLTFKSTPAKRDEQFKVYRELEIGVSDFQRTRDILHALGFVREQIYEKWRETLILPGIQFCLDTMPFGDFLELEGTRSRIRQYADLLGLEWKRRILTNYLAIFEGLKSRMQLNFEDPTFDNFKTVDNIPAAFIQPFEAG